MEKVVTALMRGGVTPAQIGVITPYEGQRAHVVTTMLRVRVHGFRVRGNPDLEAMLM